MNSSYSVKYAYVFLRGELEGENNYVYVNFWRIKILPSTHVTAWRVLENKLVTKTNLERRGVMIENSMCMCILFCWMSTVVLLVYKYLIFVLFLGDEFSFYIKVETIYLFFFLS